MCLTLIIFCLIKCVNDFVLCCRWCTPPPPLPPLGQVSQRRITINKQRDSFRAQQVFPAFFLYFADHASQYIYLNINQLDALNFIMSLFHASTYLEHKCSSSGGQNCTIQSLVSSHVQVVVPCTGPLSTCAPDGHLQV